MSAIFIDDDATTGLRALRARAARAPIDMTTLIERMEIPAEKAKLRRLMTAQSLKIDGPWAYLITFSIETGHPCGVCRHMSMSVTREGRVPSPEAVWLIAQELGFAGVTVTDFLMGSQIWLEDLEGHGKAVNVVQPLTFTDSPSIGALH